MVQIAVSSAGDSRSPLRAPMWLAQDNLMELTSSVEMSHRKYTVLLQLDIV